MEKKVCRVCGGKHSAKGLCLKHYKQAKSAEYYLAHKAESAAKSAKWQAANPKRTRELNRASAARNKEKRNAYSRRYRAEHLERCRASARAWSKRSPDKYTVTKAKRRAAQNGQRLRDSEFDTFVIKEIYSLARLRTALTGVEWHVDHLVPLRHPKVSGLHCAANLRVITAQANRKKGNRVWPDMPEQSRSEALA